MKNIENPKRSKTVRLATLGSLGIAAVSGTIYVSRFLTDPTAVVQMDVYVASVAALCALCAMFAALSFFAGVDESEDYVFQETHIDKLTGFHTRVAMIGYIAEALTKVLKSGKPQFLIDVDIDRFKQINDQIGFEEGDELIRAAGERLRAFFGENTRIGRMGAGEFAIIIDDDIADFEAMLDVLVERLMEPYRLKTHHQTVTFSAGVVAMPKDGRDPLQLMRRANLALQRARADGIGGWSVFENEMGRVADYRQWVESELTDAIDRGDFVLYYQPQLSLKGERIVGYEALIRWQHPERGLIPPNEFIPVAEESGMILQIGKWALHQGCHDACMLPDDTYVAINLSPVQFGDRALTETVRQALEESGLPANRLELEITETAMTMDRIQARKVMASLSEMGVQIAIDDFGTGYSNLSYLMDFTFHKLKIDRSFVCRLQDDDTTGAVISTIVGLSRALGAETLAEGVETADQATLLRAAGCDSVQGFHYARPAPLSTFVDSESAGARLLPRAVGATYH
ncbi:putative bifunctional diguanylate cyclase/phosphodiesterase [Notoacmeibacter ruber]|uniref:Bifunctional diguanylate cyclase/phosphodiesterase n=1 Tax=Notoacmeibacter ruber TaxID=2670375 RepID=A0A3L7J8E5_9HYPH|nr:bifunctional diguanylate cyclase/phosphodiesterase [Notoacmeibacter ruber]RLQ87007.1 bifunctional diguanylate cyclase/phosphodiesterase [Notoacmeibacter ruber]